MRLVRLCPRCGGDVDGRPALELRCTSCAYELTEWECHELVGRRTLRRRSPLVARVRQLVSSGQRP